MSSSLVSEDDDYDYQNELFKAVYHQTYLSSPTFAAIEPTETILIAIYVTIGFSGFFSNLFVIISLLRSSSLRFFPYNVLLINIFVSNIFMSTFCVPFTLVTLIRFTWDYGMTLCKLIPALQGIGVCVHSTAITVAAIDRYLDVMARRRPFIGVYYSNFSRVCLGSALIWILGTVIGSPHAIYQTVKEHNYNVTLGSDEQLIYSPSTLYTCTQEWDPKIRSIYTILIFLCEAIIPTIVLVFTSFAIRNNVQGNPEPASDAHGTRTNYASTDFNHEVRDNSINKTLMIVTISFIVCWMPFNLVHVLIDLNVVQVKNWGSTKVYLVTAIFHTIAMMSAPLSALVYGYFTPSIRRSICCRRRLPEDDREEEGEDEVENQELEEITN